MTNLQRNTSPGKFENKLVIDMIANYISLGGCNETVLIDDDFGTDLYTRLVGPFSDTFSVELTANDRDYLNRVAGCIIRKDCYEAISVRWFDSITNLDRTWSKLKALVEE